MIHYEDNRQSHLFQKYQHWYLLALYCFLYRGSNNLIAMKTEILIVKLIICFIVLLSVSCKHEETTIVNNIGEIQNPYNLPLVYSFSHSGNTFESEVIIGIWMFKNNHIANWLGKSNDGEEIYEPINVIWIDYVSSNENEAKEKVAGFLGNNSFKTRGGSSTGYFTFMGDSIVLKKIKQNPSDKTWSDGNALVNNNHGRIFIGNSTTGNAFYTLGAFSREKGISHNFISFNSARDALNLSGKWVIEGIETNIPNIHPPGSYSGFSTKDHDRVLVFVLYP